MVKEADRGYFCPYLYGTNFWFNFQDGASLIKAVVSKEAKLFRQQFCCVIADIFYSWTLKAFGQGIAPTRYSSQAILASGIDNIELSSSPRLSTPINYEYILRDRRLKVIFLHALKSARKHPILMLRFCLVSFAMLVTASAIACHRVVVFLSEASFGQKSYARKQYAMST